jgi:hypothetical protein
MILNSGLSNGDSERNLFTFKRSLNEENKVAMIIQTTKEVILLFDQKAMRMGNAVEPKYAMDTTNLYKASLWSIVVSFGLSRKCIENRRCPTKLIFSWNHGELF